MHFRSHALRSCAAIACTVAPLFAQATVKDPTKIELPDAETLDNFGRQVLLQGDQMLVMSNAVDSMGAAYAYRRIGGVWTFEQKFRGADTTTGDFFGFSAEREGDLLVIGAYQHDSAANQGGAAYVFERVGGNWVELDKLTSPDVVEFDYWGRSVAIGGDLVVVGAPSDDDDGVSSGAVYVFRRSGNAWNFEQKLTASTADAEDQLGWKVETDGTTIAATAIEDEEGGDKTGALFTFEHNGATWVEEQRLLAPDGADGDWFGWSLDMQGDTIVAGAADHDQPANSAGAAYVFERSAGTWSFAQKLSPSKIGVDDLFGWSVALDGDRLAVGSSGVLGDPPTPAGFGDGAVYVYHHTGIEWVQVTQQLSGDLDIISPPFLPQMGMACDISGTTLVGGAPFGDADNAVAAGAVYVFNLSDLGLEATPAVVPFTGSFDLETYGGRAGDVMGVFTASIGGVSTFLFLGLDVFDANGEAVFSAVAPPSVSGLEIRFFTAGHWQSGVVGISNIVKVEFQ